MNNNICFFDKSFEEQVKYEEKVFDKIAKLNLNTDEKENMNLLLQILKKTIEYRIEDMEKLNLFYPIAINAFFSEYKGKNKEKLAKNFTNEEKEFLKYMENNLENHIDEFIKIREKNITRYKRLLNKINMTNLK